MVTITVSEERLNKVLSDVEVLIEDVSSLLGDDISRKRLSDIKKDPSIGKSEKDLDLYLKARGVQIE